MQVRNGGKRYFDKVLDSVCGMCVDLIKPLDPDFTTTPKEICEDSRYVLL